MSQSKHDNVRHVRLCTQPCKLGHRIYRTVATADIATVVLFEHHLELGRLARCDVVALAGIIAQMEQPAGVPVVVVRASDG